ncbi:MAG: hypothetical protein COA99_05330 [Moraxellaceae bacterium]|nr:MAG: hypothetical protein COA99_05330 [Moraxellaceae bacterium]
MKIRYPSLLSALALTVAVNTPIAYADDNLIAADIVPQLEDTPLDLSQLHTYDELVDELYEIERQSLGLINVGPLIKNGHNGGLINIDRKYSRADRIKYRIRPRISNRIKDPTEKHMERRTTLRQSVVNTVLNDSVPTQGNVDLDKVGYSNFGKALMAARFGHGPTKVVYITQQHGNEFIATEAAFDFLRDLAALPRHELRKMRRKISLLMIVRANPDGGEPDPERCQVGTPFLPIGADPYECAFYRFNIDSTAGLVDTEDSFRGAAGYGYNLNRYHIPMLDSPIRPVENQAMVAAMKAFKPNYIMDLHGDVPKVTCEQDTSSTSVVVPGLLFDVACDSSEGTTLNDISIRDMAEFHGNTDAIAQHWSSEIINNLSHLDMQVGRHRQFGESEEIINTPGGYSLIEYNGQPVHTMLLEQRTLGHTADPIVVGFDFSTPEPSPNVNFALNTVLGQSNFESGIEYNRAIMMEGLKVIVSQINEAPTDDGGYSLVPTDSGFLYQFSPLTQSVLGLTTPGPYLYPLCLFEECFSEE